MASTPSELIIGAVGDVAVDRDDPMSGFAPVLPLLRRFDVVFGNCEAPYTNRTERAPSAGLPLVIGPENADALGEAGFSVMSCANNHIVDAGHEGLADTLASLRRQGIQTCGAGQTPEEAFAPAIVERRGTRVAFLAYSFVYPPGYDARHGRPGIATVRTHTVYYSSDLQDFQSGGQPERFTVANPEDVRRVEDDIGDARAHADVVVVSCHWGDGTGPVVLTEYERQVAHAAIDAGADIVLGHHHHIVRGIEIYHGKPIFYGLGHFVFDMPGFADSVTEDILRRMRERAGEYGYAPRDDYPLLPMHPEARMAMIAVCVVRDGTIAEAGIIPCLINPEGQPVPLRTDSVEGRRVCEYIESVSQKARLNGRCESISSIDVESYNVVWVRSATRTS